MICRCRFCYDCTVDSSLDPSNDFSSISIGDSYKGFRIMFSSGYGKPPRIEVDFFNNDCWHTVATYYPSFCPFCGRKLEYFN